MTKVSLIIPTYNRGDILADTIRMAAGQNYPDYEIIVVDQDSVIPYAVQQAIVNSGQRARLIRLSPPNLPAARNAGVRAARGEIIVFVDDDVIVGPEFVAAHVRAYCNPLVGGATGLTMLSHESNENVVYENLIAMYGLRQRNADGTANVRWLVGCNCSFRKSAILEAGMSDERFTGWAEDADLSVRVEHLGYTLLFDPQIRLVHLALPTGGCELRLTGERRVEDLCRMYLFFCLKNRAILGGLTTARNVWRTYRHYSMNRSVIRPYRKLAARQGLFLRGLLGALRLVRMEQIRTDADCQEVKLSNYQEHVT